MKKKSIHLGDAATSAGKSAAGFLTKAKDAIVNAVDQNDDGKFGIDDIAIVSDTVKTAVKDGSNRWSEKQEKRKREKELETLRPIFEADIEMPEFSLPKLIRIAEMDEKHSGSEVCRDSIGFVFLSKELDILTLYPERIADFGLRFYPDIESEMYYVDPTDRDFYIALDDYFNYLRVARVSELQKIAQDLGAKHFRVTYKEQKKSFSSLNVGGKGMVKALGKGAGMEAEHRRSEDIFSKIEIAAEMECIGHKPVEPTLKYFKKDPQIQSLVSLRMADNPMMHQVYTLNLSSSSGIKIKDAAKIDAALSAMKISGNATVTSEAQNEDRRIFEYEIHF